LIALDTEFMVANVKKLLVPMGS